MRRQRLHERWGKRALDLVGASLALIAACPLLAICAFAIKRQSSGPVLFRQRRAGQFGKPFEILKLRTMVDRQSPGHSTLTVAGDLRITRVGHFLRRHKLDEIPQLINVLRGEMSLVGPRPETFEFVDQYTSEQRAVLDLKPGITGAGVLAFPQEEELLRMQCAPLDHYRRVLIPAKIQIELAYGEQVSLAKDMSLLLRTVVQLARIKI